MPKMGRLKMLHNPALKGLRVWPVQGFEEILIFYQVSNELLRVIRILHGKRDVTRILERERGRE
jgi:toxin ParE1/3/4